MRHRILKRTLLFAVLAAVALAATPAPQEAEYEIAWSTVDGGGISFAAGEGRQLGATAGQADAGVVSGGSYELSGGFWIDETQGGTIFGDGFESGGLGAWSDVVGAQ